MLSNARGLEAICQGFANLHELWAVPVELGIALYLLYRQLGLAFMAPAAVAIFSTAGIFAIAEYMGAAQKVWIQGIQTRVAATAVMLGSMKVSFSLRYLIIRSKNYAGSQDAWVYGQDDQHHSTITC